jgi:hypothetical protein
MTITKMKDKLEFISFPFKFFFFFFVLELRRHVNDVIYYYYLVLERLQLALVSLQVLTRGNSCNFFLSYNLSHWQLSLDSEELSEPWVRFGDCIMISLVAHGNFWVYVASDSLNSG